MTLEQAKEVVRQYPDDKYTCEIRPSGSGEVYVAVYDHRTDEVIYIGSPEQLHITAGGSSPS